ncbi:MAG: ATP-dependent helicase [Bacilli bacterium]|jgi:DNA helicase-2/ATP-dependent DNA helicase PcrA
MNLYKNLNPEQLKAITTKAQYVRVIAGAGSGKTRVLTTRIAYLLYEYGVPEERIVGFTFTNKAAEEMRSRVEKMLDYDDVRVRLSTFHSFGARLLREDIDVLGYTQSFIIYDEEDSSALIRNISVERGHERRGDLTREAIAFIGACKEKGLDAFEYVVRPHGYVHEKEFVEIWKEYERRLKAANCLDFADLINKSIKILENHPRKREKWQKRIDYILVDEFQDTNDLQYTLIKLLMNENTALYVVGDPDQTIYTWRGANEGIIMNFDRDFKKVETIILEQNYRSTKYILEAANKLIQHNKNRIEKNLFTAEEKGEPVLVHFADSDSREVNWIYEQIISMKLNIKGFSLRDVAILLRANYLTLPFERHFLHKNVPYRIYGGLRFYQRREVKDVLAYLRLLVNEKDNVSFERIINVPRRGMGEVAMENLKIAALKNEYSLFQTVRYVEDIGLSKTSKEQLKSLIDAIDDARAKLLNDKLEMSTIINDYVQKVGYYDFIKTEKDEEKQSVMRANVQVLIEDIKQFMRDYPEASFNDYLENASLHSAQDEVEEGDYITLMTVHMAKGLEYDYVFVAALVEGVFPNNRAIMDAGRAGEEEERRLCYVAFTRARKRLYLTMSSQYNFAIASGGRASRFIAEAGVGPPKIKEYHPKYGTPLIKGRPKRGEQEAPRFRANYAEYDYAGDFPYAVNDIVEHKTLGPGVVTAIFPSQTTIEVRFDTGEVKRLIASPKYFKEK